MGVSPRIVHYSDVEMRRTPERIGRFAGTVAAADGPDALVVGTGDSTGRECCRWSRRRAVARPRHCADARVRDAGEPRFRPRTRDDAGDYRTSPQAWLTANVEQDGERVCRRLTRPCANRIVDGALVGFVGVTVRTRPRRFHGDDADGTIRSRLSARRATALRDAGAEAVVVLYIRAGRRGTARACDADEALGGHVDERRIDRLDGTCSPDQAPTAGPSLRSTLPDRNRLHSSARQLWPSR